jgi:hypothetical protein
VSGSQTGHPRSRIRNASGRVGGQVRRDRPGRRAGAQVETAAPRRRERSVATPQTAAALSSWTTRRSRTSACARREVSPLPAMKGARSPQQSRKDEARRRSGTTPHLRVELPKSSWASRTASRGPLHSTKTAERSGSSSLQATTSGIPPLGDETCCRTVESSTASHVGVWPLRLRTHGCQRLGTLLGLYSLNQNAWSRMVRRRLATSTSLQLRRGSLPSSDYTWPPPLPKCSRHSPIGPSHRRKWN